MTSKLNKLADLLEKKRKAKRGAEDSEAEKSVKQARIENAQTTQSLVYRKILVSQLHIVSPISSDGLQV